MSRNKISSPSYKFISIIQKKRLSNIIIVRLQVQKDEWKTIKTVGVMIEGSDYVRARNSWNVHIFKYLGALSAQKSFNI